MLVMGVKLCTLALVHVERITVEGLYEKTAGACGIQRFQSEDKFL